MQDYFPDLGALFPLLGVSSDHKWAQIIRPLVGELFDRNILWICKFDESAIAVGLLQACCHLNVP